MVKLCISALASMLAYTYAAVAIFPYEPKPVEFEDQSGCYLSSLNRVLPYNEPYYPKGDNTCLEYRCETNNETKLFSCGAIAIPPECYLEYDYTLDYPDCCGKPVCPPTTTVDTCVTVTGPCVRPVVPTPRIPTTGNYVAVKPTGTYVRVTPTTGSYVVTPTNGNCVTVTAVAG